MNPTVLPLLAGGALGLSVAVPFGPVTLLCVQRSITMGAGLGIITGLGAASVNVLYASLAISGARAIATELTAWSQTIRVVSCTFLIILGLRALRRRPPILGMPHMIRAPAAFASSFILASCNPMTILPYLLFASSAAATEPAQAALTLWSALGVFLGVATWYCVISNAAALFQSGLSPGAVRVLNRVAGATLIGFGLLTAYR